MGIQDALYSAPGGAIPAGAVLADDSSRLDSLTIATNEHGYAECASTAPLGLPDAFLHSDLPGIPHRRVSAGVRTIYEGRLVDRSIINEGIGMTALGYSQALTDLRYTALWSKDNTTEWRPVLNTEYNTCYPDRYTFDTNNRIYITPVKGSNQGNAPQIVGRMMYQIPNGSSRQIIGLSFDYSIPVAANWNFGAESWLSGFTSPAGIWAQAGGAGALTGSVNVTLTAADIVDFYMTYNAANVNVAGETGDVYLRITNVRIVTSTANRINTTLGTAIAAGTRTVTPASMARIAVGQALQIGGTITERVTVTAITTTTFTAVFAQAHLAADAVQAHVVYGDEIAKDMVAAVSALNPTQLATSTALVQSPGLDLFDEIYLDALPSDILNYLITLGDNQATPRQWEWAVWDNRILQFQPRGATSQAWYVDVGTLTIDRSIDQLINSVYGIYNDTSGRALRTAANTNAASIARAGIAIQGAVTVSSASATQAGVQRDAFLNDRKDPIPKLAIGFNAVYDAGGSRQPLYGVRSGDTITIRNLPPTLSTTIDRIRTFRIVRTMYDAVTDTIAVEPESPLPTLDALLARLAAAIG